jgi:hypothetical protein
VNHPDSRELTASDEKVVIRSWTTSKGTHHLVDVNPMIQTRRSTMATGEVQTDNGVFRVTKWTIEPHDAIPMHVHEYDYVVVPLVDDVMLVRSADGSEASAEIRCGVSYERKAGAEHTVINPGNNVIQFVEVERLS